MAYPTFEQFNEAFQNHNFTLLDSSLKTGIIKKNKFGIPVVISGGFALTYTISTDTSKYAVRCFHKQSNELEKRYEAITKKIKSLNSSYFVDFEFQSNGIVIGGNLYPIVKMIWAKGMTLGEFLSQNYKNQKQLRQLQISFRRLSVFLETNNMAHGDIAPDNIMVSNDGNSIQLIDYDGMYVEDLKYYGSSELGNRNFQHPKRTESIFNKTLDRFSFILLDTVIEILIYNPKIWETTNSDANGIIFRATDFSNPNSSAVFKECKSMFSISEKVKGLERICKEISFANIPSLNDYLYNSISYASTTNIPKSTGEDITSKNRGILDGIKNSMQQTPIEVPAPKQVESNNRKIMDNIKGKSTAQTYSNKQNSRDDPSMTIIDTMVLWVIAIIAIIGILFWILEALPPQGYNYEAHDAVEANATEINSTTDSLEAYEYYELSDALWNSRTATYSNPGTALDYLNKAIELDPNNRGYYHNRGFIKEQMGKFKEAISDYKKALKLDPKDGYAYGYIAIASDEWIEILENADLACKYELGYGCYVKGIVDYDYYLQMNDNEYYTKAKDALQRSCDSGYEDSCKKISTLGF